MLRGDPPAARRALITILAAFALVGVLYGFASPMFETSDEVRHFALIEHYALGNGFPVQDPDNLGFYEQEGSQPPLYYLLLAPLSRAVGIDDFRAIAQFNPHAKIGRADTTDNWNMLIHREQEWALPWRGTTLALLLARWLGVAMGVVTVAATYGLARALASGGSSADGLWPRVSPAVPVLAAGLVAFNPMFIYISASANNDTLLVMLSSLVLCWAAAAIRGAFDGRSVTYGSAVGIGTLIGLAALTKSSGLVLAAVVPIAVLVADWLSSRSFRRLVRQAVFMGAPIALIAGWWYARNQILYGDVTGTMMQAVIDGLRDPPVGLFDVLGEWGGFRQAFWGLFGGVNIPMPAWIYTLLDALVLAGMAGMIVLGAQDFRRRREAARHARIAVTLMCAAVLALNVLALLRWTMLTYASQGRLLFPSIAVVGAFTALGLVHLATRVAAALGRGDAAARLYAPRLAPVHLAPLLALALVVPFAFLLPAYARPPRGLSEADLPPDLTRTELRFGDAIRWIGFRVNSPRARVNPGDALDVTLYWQALKPASADYSAGIRLFGRGGSELALLDTYPGGGMLPTTQWRAGEVIADRYRLPIAATLTATAAAPGALALDVGLWDFGTRQFLPTSDGQGRPTGRQRYEAAGLSAPADVAAILPGGQHLQKAHIDGVTTKLSEQDAQGRRRLTAVIGWVAADDFGPGEDNTTFVHLFNAAGERVAQIDARPIMPTRWWRKMDRVGGDTYTLDLPAGLPPGDYVLKFGQYRPSDGARMPAFDAAGGPIGDAALSVPVRIP